MSFWKRCMLTIGLLLVIGVPLSATYHEPAQAPPAGAQEGSALPSDDDEAPVPGAPAPADSRQDGAGRRGRGGPNHREWRREKCSILDFPS